MRAIYNGVDMMALETFYFDWQPVYDDSTSDYLYTRVAFASRSLINGISSVSPVSMADVAAMNYGFQSDLAEPRPGFFFRPNPTTTLRDAQLTVPPGYGLANAQGFSTLRAIVRNPNGPASIPRMGNPPTETHEAIRHRLSVPRGKLYIFFGAGMEVGAPPAGSSLPPNSVISRLFLESPQLWADGIARTDCKNGPIPRVLSVHTPTGDATTMMVDWSIETFVNESPLNEVRQVGALLSNRFSQTHEIDEEGYTRVNTVGTAIYRTDRNYMIPHSPDEDRPFLVMPILQGFTRVINYVRGREDATGVDYSYTDTQVKTNFVAGPYTKGAGISIVHNQAIITDANLFEGALGAYERIISIRANKKIAKPDEETPTTKTKKKALVRPAS